MYPIVFLLPSYLGDIEYAKRLLISYKKFNVDNIPLYIAVQNYDKKEFERFVGGNINLITYQEITDNLVNDDSVRGIRPGYINQEIIKLAFWEKKVCKNYFCLDSDGEFVRPFFISDFLYDDDTPFTILVEDHELIVEPQYYREYWIEREKLIRLIQKQIGLNDERMMTSHGFSILSCKVLKSFFINYLVPNNLMYADLLRISPYEFSWYNMWLQKDNTIPLQIKEPLFKCFHNKSHHLEYLEKGITLNDISRGYIGIVINSNYSRGYGVVSYEDGNVYDPSLKDIEKSLMKFINLFRRYILLNIKRKLPIRIRVFLGKIKRRHLYA